MAIYAITVEETLSKTVLVEADSLEDAKTKVEDFHNEVGIDMDYRDYDGYEVRKSYYANPDGTATEDQIKCCELLDVGGDKVET